MYKLADIIFEITQKLLYICITLSFSKHVSQPKERPVTSSRPLILLNLVHKKGLGGKEKIKLKKSKEKGKIQMSFPLKV